MEGLIPQLVYQKYKDLLHLKRYGHPYWQICMLLYTLLWV